MSSRDGWRARGSKLTSSARGASRSRALGEPTCGTHCGRHDCLCGVACRDDYVLKDEERLIAPG